MLVSQYVTLFIPEDKESVFFEKLKTRATESGWQYAARYPYRYSNSLYQFSDKLMDVAPFTRLYVDFESRNIPFLNEVISGSVLFGKRNGYYEIVSKNVQYLDSTVIGYNGLKNHVLNYFYDQLLSEIVKELNLKVFFSNPEKSISEIIGNKAAMLFKPITKYADKTMGINGIYSCSRSGWNDLILMIHLNKINIEIDDLIAALEEEGWSHGLASEIGYDFIHTLNFLDYYDRLLTSSSNRLLLFHQR